MSWNTHDYDEQNLCTSQNANLGLEYFVQPGVWNSEKSNLQQNHFAAFAITEPPEIFWLKIVVFGTFSQTLAQKR